ncbi:MAG TPA: HK97 gp10 family phage protein [Gammaproteobacteria bacterium]|nr:HK97 gp10 family phage protein [Gammaproteobacteria bacterium]
MPLIELIIDDSAVQRAFNAAPALTEQELERAIRRAIGLIGNTARSGAPEHHGILRNSIKIRYVKPLTGEVSSGVDYARMVEEGTGPGGRPPLQSISDWIKRKGMQPRDPSMDDRDLAFVIAQSIAMHGTSAQPYMQPALEKHRDSVIRLVDEAVDRALKRMRDA